jgi:hypothetical protein
MYQSRRTFWHIPQRMLQVVYLSNLKVWLMQLENQAVHNQVVERAWVV